MPELPADCGSNSLVNVATITDFGFRRNWDSSGLDLAFLKPGLRRRYLLRWTKR